MPPHHHPDAQLLADFLTGDCSPGSALLVGRHVQLCPRCLSRLQQMGVTGTVGPEPAAEAWRAASAGVEVALLTGAGGVGEAVLAIRAERGAPMALDAPLHIAEVLVLQGKLEHGGETYRAGDFLALAEPPAPPVVAVLGRGFSGMITTLQPQFARDVAATGIP